MKSLLFFTLITSSLNACPIPDFIVKGNYEWEPQERVEMHREGIEGCLRTYGAGYCPVTITKTGIKDYQTICGLR